VLCAGAAVLDTIVRPLGELRWGTTTFVDTIDARVGGSAANTARALGILGVPVRLAAVLGRDHAGDIIRRELARCNVDASAIETADEASPQTIVLVNTEGERQFLHRKGSSAIAFRHGFNFAPEQITGIAHFHIASLYVVPHLRSHAASMLREAHAHGLTTSLDTSWDPEGEWMKVLEPCLAHLDVLFMNEDEAAQLAGGGTVEALASAALREGTGMVAIKHSVQGCRIYSTSQQTTCPAYHVEVRDTTGAGDCFVAGFLAAYLEGALAERAGLFANATGALSVQQIGAVEGLLPRLEQETWMARTPLRNRPL
jgi:sugar/nucleoside kinase (ribokinase family)